MGKRLIVAAICVLLVLSGPVLLHRRAVPAACASRTWATAKTPFAAPWKDRLVTVYAGNTNVFSMWEDPFDDPTYLYAFADKQRILCVYNNDTAVLVFVVECGASATNTLHGPCWLTDSYLRQVLTQMATNVVAQTNGFVRLPSLAEVQEASNHVRTSTVSGFRAASFPSLDLGFYRFYLPKDFVLQSLATNRTSCWPTQ